jgi:hypothetical protein
VNQSLDVHPLEHFLGELVDRLGCTVCKGKILATVLPEILVSAIVTL